MWLGKGTAAVVGEGHKLEPGEYYRFTLEGDPFVGDLYAILASAPAVDIPVEEAIN